MIIVSLMLMMYATARAVDDDPYKSDELTFMLAFFAIAAVVGSVLLA